MDCSIRIIQSTTYSVGEGEVIIISQAMTIPPEKALISLTIADSGDYSNTGLRMLYGVKRGILLHCI